jgi:hypothetical protein
LEAHDHIDFDVADFQLDDAFLNDLPHPAPPRLLDTPRSHRRAEK